MGRMAGLDVPGSGRTSEPAIRPIGDLTGLTDRGRGEKV